jgi:hypothetical protein
MNYAVNHLRTEMHTEKTDHEDTEAIAQDGEWNDERDKGKPSPPTSQEQIGGQNAGYKKYEARSNTAAFLRNLDCDVWQLENKALPEKGRAAKVKEKVGYFGRRIF